MSYTWQILKDLKKEIITSVYPLAQDSENGTDIVDTLLEAVQGVSSMVQATGRLPPKFNPEEFLPEDRTSFFRYTGSLTTPPCSEIVTWTVMTSTVPVSKEQVTFYKDKPD